ncbi:MAG: transcriptional regulator [Gammaproteobacteria bacterium]|nr:transcriptional regulator [Gammaproteobacteria bacterium]MBT3722958.1 transcriptional regulator [Gammaproteobacteria bacterium]MBT4075088.1 transcriptional regulator [Gammaproteobacteria bacterium]MBT4195553.1 transcriptional regulator [Gammaproteobacteria bacterium]MBT4448208.1 transcriptional regulator [Gammaproteobacteria bacterium]
MPSMIIADALFTKSQQRVLSLLFGKPDASFYTNEIVRQASMGRGTITRELEKLASSGLVTVTKAGNQRHYQANQESPVYKELSGIVRKTFGIADVLKQALQPVIEKLELAFVYGSIAKGTETFDSDIDLMLIGGGLNYNEVIELLMPAEESLQRDINPTLFTQKEYQNRLEDGQSFLQRVMDQPKIMIKGEIDDTGKSA